MLTALRHVSKELVIASGAFSHKRQVIIIDLEGEKLTAAFKRTNYFIYDDYYWS